MDCHVSTIFPRNGNNFSWQLPITKIHNFPFPTAQHYHSMDRTTALSLVALACYGIEIRKEGSGSVHDGHAHMIFPKPIPSWIERSSLDSIRTASYSLLRHVPPVSHRNDVSIVYNYVTSRGWMGRLFLWCHRHRIVWPPRPSWPADVSIFVSSWIPLRLLRIECVSRPIQSKSPTTPKRYQLEWLLLTTTSSSTSSIVAGVDWMCVGQFLPQEQMITVGHIKSMIHFARRINIFGMQIGNPLFIRSRRLCL